MLLKRSFLATTQVSIVSLFKLGIKYDKLLVASGGTPRRPFVPGIDLGRVYTLRSGADQAQIKAAIPDAQRVVVVGASFIGMETASSIKMKFPDKQVTVVDMSDVPFKHVLGAEVGVQMKALFEKEGVDFVLGQGLQGIEGSAERNASAVKLTDGRSIDADLVIVGAGIQCATQFASGVVDMQKDGSIECSPFLRTSDENIFAAGDVCSYPDWVSGERVRTEHWSHALQQGTTAAFNMLGKVLHSLNMTPLEPAIRVGAVFLD